MPNLNLSLKTASRQETGKKLKLLREQGKSPAVLYGHKIKPVSLLVDYSVFEKIFKAAGESTLVDLSIDDQKPVKVLIQDYQLDPVSNQFIHVDFHQVRMDEKLHTEISLKFVGEAPAVKDYSGILVTNLHHLAVECLTQDLVHEIEVDLSPLKTLDSVIKVSDIKAPPGITILNAGKDAVVLVQPPRTEKELEDLEAKPEAKLPAEAAEAEAEKAAAIEETPTETAEKAGQEK